MAEETNAMQSEETTAVEPVEDKEPLEALAADALADEQPAADEPAADEPVDEAGPDNGDESKFVTAKHAAVEPVAEEASEAPTGLIDPVESATTSVFAPMPTEPIAEPTETISAPVEPTTPMPNPYPDPQSTTPIPEPAPTMAGFDIPVADPVPAEPAAPVAPAVPVEMNVPTTPNDPYASAVSAAGAAAAGAAAAAAPAYAQAAPQAQAVPPQPVEPWRQASQGGYQQATYADPDFRAGTYQNAVQHQPYVPDPQVNAYEQVMPAPQTELTGVMKFGWLCVGFLLGIPGMIIAWLVNVDRHPQVKHDAIMWSVIGFVIQIVLGLIASIAFAGMMVGLIEAAGGMSGYYF